MTRAQSALVTANTDGNLRNELGGQLDIGTLAHPGTLEVTNNFVQDAQSVLNVRIGGTDSGQFSRLDVGITATLNGTLNVSLVNNFTPSAAGEGDIFQFITAGTVEGTFPTTNGLNLGGGLFFDISYGAFATTLLTRD